MAKQTPARPFCLEYEDARNEVFAAINTAIQNHSVPMFLMEGILREALHQVKSGAQAERAQALQEYVRAKAEAERGEADE